MNPSLPSRLRLAAGIALLAAGTAAHADPVGITVTIENLAPTNSISFAPLRVGFNNGSYDAFNIGQVATAPIVSIAEGGGGADWFPAFAAAQPTATLGTVGGLLTPGATSSATFMVDSAVNRFFTFAAMAVPSNDFFIGNDAPMAHALFDAGGRLQLGSITLKARDLWDAGSETFDPLAAAFLAIGNNDLRTPQNSVVSFNFAELAGFNGLTTGAGYVFNSQLSAASDIYRISFAAAVPEPQTWALMAGGLFATAFLARRRRAAPAPAERGAH